MCSDCKAHVKHPLSAEVKSGLAFTHLYNGHPQFLGLNKVSKGGQYCIKMAQNDHLVQCLMQCLLINAYYFVVLLSENDNWFLNKRVFM